MCELLASTHSMFEITCFPAFVGDQASFQGPVDTLQQPKLVLPWGGISRGDSWQDGF